MIVLVALAALLGFSLVWGMPRALPRVSRRITRQVTLRRSARALVGPHDLARIFPEISTLPEDRQRAVAAALGQISAPCEPCAHDADLRLSECALRQDEGCENVPQLVRRVIRAAEQEADPARLRLLAVRGDLWVPGVAPLGEGPPVPVELWLDLGAPLLEETLDTLDALEKGPVPITLTLRSYAPKGVDRGVALAGEAAREAGKLRELARCVAAGTGREACDGLDLEGWKQRGAAPEIAPALAAEQAQALARGVRSSPTWFVRGYRMRGLQSQNALEALVAREAWVPGEAIR